MSQRKSDIVIIGGGLVGLTLACALAEAKIDVTVIEVFDPSKFDDKKFDGRASAIAHSSKQLFNSIGVWDDLKDHSGDILDIRIVDDHSPLFLHYDHSDIGDEPMGYIIENRYIRRALLNRVKKLKNINFLAPAKYKQVDYGSSEVTVKLDNGDVIKAKLLIAADGRGSNIRQLANIATIDSDYKQSGIVCTVKHERDHQGVAIENFLPAGPFAILPMAGGYHSSLVWTEKSDLAKEFMEMKDKEFLTHLGKRFSGYLGKLSIKGPKFCYPLSLSFARTYISDRMCLIGDAAHGIHPISGQGFNLGIRDVAVLAELIVDTKKLGLDIGGQVILKKYESIRKIDNMQMIAITDLLNRLFSNNVTPIKAARRVGLAAVEKQPALKKFFMRHAMGVSENSPKLLKGEKLL